VANGQIGQFKVRPRSTATQRNATPAWLGEARRGLAGEARHGRTKSVSQVDLISPERAWLTGHTLLLFGHARGVERVSRIDREAVVIDVVPIAAFVDRPLALMAIPTQRTQRPEAELVVIALMRRMMIRDRRWRDAALLFA
jgi:hypothetical protein